MLSTQNLHLEMREFLSQYLQENDKQIKYNLLVNEYGDRLRDALSNIEKINSMFKGRESVQSKQGAALDMSACNAIKLFKEDGSVDKSVQIKEGITIQFPRMIGYFKEIFTAEDQLNKINSLSDREKLILEAVFFDISFSFHTVLTTPLTTQLSDLSIERNNLDEKYKNNSDNDVYKKERQELAKKQNELLAEAKLVPLALNKAINSFMFGSGGLPVLKSQLINNADLFPQVASITSFAEYIQYALKIKMWDFTVKSGMDTSGELSRIFDNLPLPPYLKSFFEEIKNIINNETSDQYVIRKNMQTWSNKLIKQLWKDLFDSHGEIKKELLEVLPQEKWSLVDTKELKKNLVEAYLNLAQQFALDMTNTKECRENSVKTINFTKKVTSGPPGEEHTEEGTMPMQINVQISDIGQRNITTMLNALSAEIGKWQILTQDENEFAFICKEILSQVKIEEIEKTINEIFPKENETKEKFKKELLNYQIKHARQIQQWQIDLYTKDTIAKRAEKLEQEIKKSVPKDYSDYLTNKEELTKTYPHHYINESLQLQSEINPKQKGINLGQENKFGEAIKKLFGDKRSREITRTYKENMPDEKESFGTIKASLDNTSKIKKSALSQAIEESEDISRNAKVETTLKIAEDIKSRIEKISEESKWKKFTWFKFRTDIAKIYDVLLEIEKLKKQISSKLNSSEQNQEEILVLSQQGKQDKSSDDSDSDSKEEIVETTPQERKKIEKQILEKYKTIEKIGAKASHSFFTSFIDKERQELYHALGKSYSERKAHKLRF